MPGMDALFFLGGQLYEYSEQDWSQHQDTLAEAIRDTARAVWVHGLAARGMAIVEGPEGVLDQMDAARQQAELTEGLKLLCRHVTSARFHPGLMTKLLLHALAGAAVLSAA